jgi:uncharacterized protein DUF3526
LRKQHTLVNHYCFISPVIVTRGAANDLAGASLASHQHFRAQIEGFYARDAPDSLHTPNLKTTEAALRA